MLRYLHSPTKPGNCQLRGHMGTDALEKWAKPSTGIDRKDTRYADEPQEQNGTLAVLT